MWRTLTGRPPQVVAHRGGGAAAPEHTAAAYRRAIEEGADAVECDVRLTRDGEVVCLHDRTVVRTSDGHGAVSDLTYAELLALDFGAAHGQASDVMLLRDLVALLREVPRPVGLVVETKHPVRPGPRLETALADQLRELGADRPGHGDGPDVRMMSFSVLAVRRFGRLCPLVPRVLLAGVGLNPGVRTGRLPDGVTTVGISRRLLRRDLGMVARHHARGHAVHVYTVDRDADLERCFRSGVDAIITDRPAWVRAALRTPPG